MKRFFRGTDSTIHSDDQFDAVCFERVESISIEAIPFIEAIWDVAAHISSKCLKSMDQQRSSSDPIYIIITVDRNRLVMIERVTDSIHGCSHANQLEGIGIGIRFSLEEGSRFCIRTHAAVEHDLLEDGRELGECFVSLWSDGRCNYPAFNMHYFLRIR